MSRLPVVIVPVFGASDAFEACLASLLRTLPDNAEVQLCDDASPQPEIVAMMAAFARVARFKVETVVRPKNLGFVGNVNLAFEESSPNDVVLLNSDTVTTTGWLQRLAACAESDPSIATATPWSNNAEICSFPVFCRPNAAPENPDVIANAAAMMDVEFADLPTGVGFCMYIRRGVLTQLGGFDQDTFGRGYGEENDLCLRAAAHGWRNVLCSTAYVVHKGGASFEAEGRRSGGENLSRLAARYPRYNQSVADFILRDPLQPLRERLADNVAALSVRNPQHDLFTQ